MNKNILLACLACLAIAAGIIGTGAISFRNECIAAEAGIKAQRREAQNRYSNMRTSILESAGINNQYRGDVRAAFDRVVQARQGGTNEVMRAIAEANPTIDPTTYTRVQSAIERGRSTFADTQTSLVDRGRAYTSSVQSFPGSFYNSIFGLGFPRIDIDRETAIVVTEETERVFAPGGHDTPLALPN